MTNSEEVEKAGGISTEAVQAKTGKTWSQWFTILDSAGAKGMDHKQIVAHLRKKHRVAPWWTQMIAVAYEQERGLREKHETPQGYQMSTSKTVAADVDDLFRWWKEPKVRSRWLPDPDIEIRKATPPKSVRATWVDGKTHLDVNFYAKGDQKSQVTVQHSKLRNKNDVTRMKAYWSKALQQLQEMMENQS